MGFGILEGQKVVKNDTGKFFIWGPLSHHNRENLPLFDFRPHFSPLNDLPGPWNLSRQAGRTQKWCVGYKEHQNRTTVARFSSWKVKIALLLGKAKMGPKRLKRATAVRFWCSWYPTQYFWVRPVILDRFQGPGRSFSGEKWGRKSKSGFSAMPR